jgi:hypothetical protein
MQSDEVRISRLVDSTERAFVAGAASRVAHVEEFFRNYTVEGYLFDFYARGHTRSSGGLIFPKILAFTVLPDYKVSLFGQMVSSFESYTTQQLAKLLDAVKRNSERKDIKWSWVILFGNTPINSVLSDYVIRYSRPDIGIGLLSPGEGVIAHSSNKLGRAIVNSFRLDRLAKRE